MRKAFVALSLAGAAIVPGAADAADVIRGPSPYYSRPAPSIYNWSGLYAGVNVGYEWGNVTNSVVEPNGFLGGAQAGYNWQSGQFVFGVEGDIQATGADDTFAPYKFSNPWFGTLRGRAGWALNNILIYGTLGFAIGELKGESFGLDESKTLGGWTGGVGVEVGLMPNWSAKVEYLYMDLGNRAYSITGTTNGLESNVFRLGVNYHF